MQELPTTSTMPRRSGPRAVRIAIVIGATLALLGSAVAVLAAPVASPTAASPDIEFGFGPGGPGRGGGVAGPISITAIDGSNISLKTDDGWTRTITLTSSTTITKGNDTIKVTDLKVGDDIRLAQTKNADGTYTVTAIRVVMPHVVGTVTAKSDSSITVLQMDGTSSTVHTDGDTTYRVPGATDANLGDISVGMIVIASGTLRSDGSLDADAVAAGFGGRGFHGPGGWDVAPGASPSPSASTTTS